MEYFFIYSEDFLIMLLKKLKTEKNYKYHWHNQRSSKEVYLLEFKILVILFGCGWHGFFIAEK